MTTKKDSTKGKSGEEKTVTSKWETTIGSFAKAIGVSPEDVNAKLKNLVGEPSDEALSFLFSEEDCPAVIIKDTFIGVPVAKLNNAIRTILRNGGKTTETSKSETTSSAAMVSLDILPKEISEENLLEFLRTGGVLKVNSATVIMAMRAALASRTGVFDIRKTLIDKMMAHSESLDESVGENFFKIHNELTREKYGDIFAAIPGGGSKFVSEAAKRAFLVKMNSNLWPSLNSFQEQITGWVQSWQQGASNPAAMMMAMTAMMSGNTGGPLPTGIMAPPPTDGLRDAASSFIDIINKVFSGTGTIVASALGYEAKTLMDVLSNTDLPAQIGAANKDQMLKMLNINVSADVSRLATNAARYALSIMEFPKVTAGNEEMAYITALFQLGAAIPWEQLKGVSKTGIGSNQL